MPVVKEPTIVEMITSLALGVISQFINPGAPSGRALLYQSNTLNPNSIPEMPIVIDLRYRNRIDRNQFYTWMSFYGFNSAMADEVYDGAIRMFDAKEYITLWRRKEIDDETLVKRLQALRYPAEDIPNLVKVTEFFPSPGDLVRFAVREVYSPAIRNKFGMDEDRPEKFMQEAAKAGLPDEQARNFWAAHWELPSIMQGFEMLHRRVIDKDTLNMLLRSLDVMPFWRDKLTAISYNPLTRVDVRRMYGTGVLSKEDVYNSYLDVGYNPENAQRMTDFTVRYESNENAGITRSNVVNAYKDRIITRDELIAYLKRLGYTDEIVAFWTNQADYDIQTKFLKDLTDDIKDQFRAGMIDVNDARVELNKKQLPSYYIDNVIEELEVLKSKSVKLPSRSDLTDWFRRQIISEEEFYRRMARLGYTDTDIHMFMTEIELDVTEPERKFLPIKMYQTWLKKGIMKEKEFKVTAHAMGISEDDILKAIAISKE